MVGWRLFNKSTVNNKDSNDLNTWAVRLGLIYYQKVLAHFWAKKLGGFLIVQLLNFALYCRLISKARFVEGSE
jgi:hypothetical protein